MATRWSSASVPGAPSDPLPTDPDWAGGSATSTSAPGRRRPPGRVAGGRGHRRRDRLVLLPAGLAGPRRLDRRSAASAAAGRRDPPRRPLRRRPPWTSGGSEAARVERAGLLRLRAEMRCPALAWLEFHVEQDAATGPAGGGADSRGGGTTRLCGSAPTFVPASAAGARLLVGAGRRRFHGVVFGGHAARHVRAARHVVPHGLVGT